MFVKKNQKQNLLGILCLGLLVPLSIPGWIKAVSHLTEEEKAMVSNLNNANRRAVEIVRPAVVYIAVTSKIEEGPFPADLISQGIGSGCIIDKRGYVITNNHVVEEADTIEVVLADGRRYKAVETFLDPDTDFPSAARQPCNVGSNSKNIISCLRRSECPFHKMVAPQSHFPILHVPESALNIMSAGF